MELKDFITTTLQEILDGVLAAQKQSAAGKDIAPAAIGGTNFPSDSNALADRQGIFTVVKFDVALTAATEDSVKAGGGIKVAVVSLGAGGETTAKNSSITRIQFSVPVRLPNGDKVPAGPARS